MKKFLPSKGFTLVELLVVVAIIAILSVIGITIFSGIQTKARNDTRRADINAIANALEVNKASAGYVALADTQFSNGKIPNKDPQNVSYCGNSTVNTQPASITGAGCGAPLGYAEVSPTVPAAGGTSWKICAWLEAEVRPTVDAQAYCRTNAQ